MKREREWRVGLLEREREGENGDIFEMREKGRESSRRKREREK